MDNFLWSCGLLVGVVALCAPLRSIPYISRAAAVADIPVVLLAVESFVVTVFPDSIKTIRGLLLVLLAVFVIWAMIAIHSREVEREAHAKAPVLSTCKKLQSKLSRIINSLDAYEVNIRLDQPYEDEESPEVARSEDEIAALIKQERTKTNAIYLDAIFDEIPGLIALVAPFKVDTSELTEALQLDPVSPEEYEPVLAALDLVQKRLGA